MQLTQEQEKKLKKIIALGEQGLPALLEYLFELEEKMDKDIPVIKGLIAKMKGDKGDEYKITKEDYKQIAPIVRELIDDDKIADKVLSMITIDYNIIAKKASEYIEVPQVDYKKIKDIVIKDIIVKDGKDADEDVITDRVINKLPQFGEQFRDGLELLNGEDRLDIKAIKGLDDYEETSRLARQPKGTQYSGIMGIKDIVAGANITIDKTNLHYPVISSTGGGGSGAVDSVNGQTGVVVLDTGDIADTLNKRYVTDANLTTIGNQSGTNTGDNAVNSLYSGLATSKQDVLNGTGFVKSTAGTISYDTSTYLTTASASSTYQPLDSDLTTIASLVATTDNFIQSKAGAWASRTVAQVKTDLGLIGTNSGDQTSIVGITGTKAQFNTAVTDGDILYVGDVTSNATHTGDVTGATALTIATAVVTNAKLANMATKTYKGRTTAGTGVPEDVSVVTLKTDLSLVKADVGLGNVDNTSDANKPVSTAQQTALDLKLGTQIAIFRDEKTSGTAGGTSTAGTTAARTLNTTHVNTITGCSLASNQITLTAGTYRIHATAPAFICDKHKLRWYNVTDASYSIEGTSSYSDASTNVVQTDANLVGRFTIAGTKVFELRHYIQSGRATNGLGVTIGQGTEVYAQVEIIKE